MRYTLRQGGRLLGGLLLACLVVGCSSEKLVQVRGRVTKNGQPLELKTGPVVGKIAVQFLPMEESNQRVGIQNAVVNVQDGTFTVPGLTGKGIPPGKYRICVYQYDPYPNVDKLNGAFSEKKPSPIVRDITGNEDIDIDVSKPQG